MTDSSTPHASTKPDYSFLNEPRFQEPPGWRWHHLTTSGGHRIRYGSVYPRGSIADAVVVCIPGMRDFGEQYFELANTMLAQNLAFWVFDWHGQGGSDRYLPNRQKRHSSGFDRDIRDLFELVDEYILPSAVHPDVGRLPLIMLGHSMGSHMGLRFLHDCNFSTKGKQAFAAAAFCAPMFWLHALENIPKAVALPLTGLLSLFGNTAYAPGDGDWHQGLRDRPSFINKYSHDPTRVRVQEAWFMKNPQLQVGGPTYRWVHETVKSCIKLNRPAYLQGIKVPTLIATASTDTIISNRQIAKSAAQIPEAVHVTIDGAAHEILMEADIYRQQFLDHFFSFIRRNVLEKQNRGLTKF